LPQAPALTLAADFHFRQQLPDFAFSPQPDFAAQHPYSWLVAHSVPRLSAALAIDLM
jgi:hypothetical protein